MKEDKGTLKVTVRDGSGRHAPIKGALVLVSAPRAAAKAKTAGTEEPDFEPVSQAETDQNGHAEIELDPGNYWVSVDTFVDVDRQRVQVKKCDCVCLVFEVHVGLESEIVACRSDATPGACPDLIQAGTPIQLRVRTDEIDKGHYSFRKPVVYRVGSSQGTMTQIGEREWIMDTTGLKGLIKLSVTLSELNSSSETIEDERFLASQVAQPITGDVSVTMRRTATAVTADLPLWTVIRNATAAISFNNYKTFIDEVMCGREPLRSGRLDVDAHCEHRSLPYPGVDAYSLVKCATEVFLMANCGVAIDFENLDEKTLLEEQGRFGRDIDGTELSKLWNDLYLVDVRRAYEYDHHYGITLQGRAVPSLRAVDSRSKFLEAFHNLLHLCSIFFKEDDDTTVIADGFPVMNAIREVHLLLAEGAHNQFGDLPSTSRQEMLIEQWLLARPEMREFLGGRIMVPYSEIWMDRVDTVKRVQGWTDTTITDFHDLAVFGEQILLSIRYGHWSDIHDPAHAANWARYWRPEIQSYIHSYRAVTGVDLTQDATESRQTAERYAQPSVHLRRRLDLQVAKR